MKLAQAYKMLHVLPLELIHDGIRCYTVLRNRGITTCMNLILVKILDYSDLLPALFHFTRKYAEAKVLRERMPGWEKQIQKCMSRMRAQMQALEPFSIEVSYIASRGTTLSHPHITVFNFSKSEDGIWYLDCRYLDYEGTLFEQYPLRAPSVTKARISLMDDRVNCCYLRQRVPQSKVFNRNMQLAAFAEDAPQLTANALEKATVAIDLEKNLFYCRNVHCGARVWSAVQCVVVAIWAEMIEQLTLLAEDATLLALECERMHRLNLNRSQLFKRTVGSKHLAIRIRRN